MTLGSLAVMLVLFDVTLAQLAMTPVQLSVTPFLLAMTLRQQNTPLRRFAAPRGRPDERLRRRTATLRPSAHDL
jgi:hypothetical protein